jgi:hypothetical protein
MAKLELSSSEPAKMIKLVEHIFPHADLSSISAIIDGITVTGTINVSKKIDATDTANLSVTITA